MKKNCKTCELSKTYRSNSIHCRNCKADNYSRYDPMYPLPTEKVERFEKVEKKPIDDFFSILDKKEELRTMPKDEYISKARDFIAKVNSMYWSNWSWRTLADDELPEESQCDNCVEGCVVKLNDVEYDCVPDRMDGVCGIRIFDEGNYADEMSDLMNEFDDIELLDTEIQLTN